MGRTRHIGEERADRIRKWAAELGFTAVGFSRAERLESEESRLEKWLAEEASWPAGQAQQAGQTQRRRPRRDRPGPVRPGIRLSNR